MLDWDKSITSYVTRQAHRVLWSLPLHEIDDLVQEGWMVFDRLKKSHGRAEMVKRHGELSDAGCRAAFMALFKTSLRNHFLNLIRAASRRPHTIGIDGNPFGAHAPYRAVEIACDLKRAPAICHILEHANWDDGVARIRQPRRLENGQLESRQDVLQRLVGRRVVGDFDAQLSMVV